MTQAQTSSYSFTPIDIGVDWLTATSKRGKEGETFLELSESILNEQRAAGVEIRPAALRDYRGRRADGLFIGERPDDSIIVLSGPRCAPYWQSVTRAASNVSRLDLQVTLWTHGEQPRLALHTYRKLSRLPNRRGRSASLTYLESKPQGETLNYGKRVSDSYGRLYDKAAEKKLGEPRTLWRYEVEFKRRSARGVAHALLGSLDTRCAIESTVHAWWSSKGVALPWELNAGYRTDKPWKFDVERDVLRWFSTSVRKTVARAIMRHGIDAVVQALGLDEYVEPRKELHGSTRRHTQVSD